MASSGAGDIILETHGLTKEFRGFVAVTAPAQTAPAPLDRPPHAT
jgi:hypothetical protein